MPTLKQIVEESDTPLGRAFDLTIQWLIVLSLVAFSIETLPDLPPPVVEGLGFLELFIVTVFTVEYLLRLWVADRKLGFIFSFLGLIDLMAILPFYISVEADLRSLRAFRLMRLFLVLKMLRYSKAMRRFHRALSLAKDEILLFGMVALLVLYLAASGIYYFENPAQPEVFASVFHCLWWSICTLTTVGYGDIYPITPGGKLFTSVVLVTGLGIISVPAGIVAAALSKAREWEEDSGDRESLSDSDSPPR